MPTRKRREKEQLKRMDLDGSYGPIDTGYVFGNPMFRKMTGQRKCAELLAWLACFKERTDHLSVAWINEITELAYTSEDKYGRVQVVQQSRQCRALVEFMSSVGRWQPQADGSVIVLKIKEKRPNFPWKEKGTNGISGAENALNKTTLRLMGESALNRDTPPSEETEPHDSPTDRPLLSVAEGLRAKLATQEGAATIAQYKIPAKPIR